MRKVRYIPKKTIVYEGLTNNKVYDVISCTNTIIKIIDNNNIQKSYQLYSGTAFSRSNNFIDVTEEYRNNIIDEILS